MMQSIFNSSGHGGPETSKVHSDEIFRSMDLWHWEACPVPMTRPAYSFGRRRATGHREHFNSSIVNQATPPTRTL